MKYLYKDDRGCFWVRRVIAKELRNHFGKTQFQKSLGVVSKSKAESLAVPTLELWRKEIKAAKEALNHKPPDNVAGVKLIPDADNVAEILITKDADNVTDEEIDTVQQWAYQGYYSGEIDERVATMQGRAVPSDMFVEKHRESIQHLTPKTINQRISRLEKEFLPNFEWLNEKSLSTRNLQRWIDSYANKKNKPSHGTLRAYYQVAKLYVEWLRKEGLLNIADTFTGVKLPSKKQLSVSNPRRPFSDKDLEQILVAIKDRELKALTILGMFTGARIEELATLKIQNVHEQNKTYWISITDSKTEAGKRQVPINRQISHIIRSRVGNTEEYLFSGGAKNQYGNRSDALSKKFGRIKTKLGFGREYVFHSIRKTVATKLEQAGIQENIAADILGHEKPNITYGLYSGGASMEQKQEAIEAIKFDINEELIKQAG